MKPDLSRTCRAGRRARGIDGRGQRFLHSLLAATLCILPPAAEAGSQRAGLFVLHNVDTPPSAVVLQRPYVAGIALQVGWRHVEPREAQFDWSAIDRTLEAARAAGKQVTIHLLPQRPPEWVRQSGIHTYTRQLLNPSDPRYGKEGIEEALPWDPLYLQKWARLTRRLGERYNDNSALFGVSVTVPSAEMMIPGSFPRDTETSRRLRQLYRRDVYLRAYQDMIDVYQEALSRKAKFVVPGPVFEDLRFADDVLAYAFTRFGDKLWVFNTGLRAVFPTRFPPMAHTLSLLREYNDKANVGFQMIWAASADRANQLQGSLREALMTGIGYGAGYIEVYQADVRNPAMQADLEYAADVLRGGRPSERR
jgi:hypothetical protein